MKRIIILAWALGVAAVLMSCSTPHQKILLTNKELDETTALGQVQIIQHSDLAVISSRGTFRLTDTATDLVSTDRPVSINLTSLMLNNVNDRGQLFNALNMVFILPAFAGGDIQPHDLPLSGSTLEQGLTAILPGGPIVESAPSGLSLLEGGSVRAIRQTNTVLERR